MVGIMLVTSPVDAKRGNVPGDSSFLEPRCKLKLQISVHCIICAPVNVKMCEIGHYFVYKLALLHHLK